MLLWYAWTHADDVQMLLHFHSTWCREKAVSWNIKDVAHSLNRDMHFFLRIDLIRFDVYVYWMIALGCSIRGLEFYLVAAWSKLCWEVLITALRDSVNYSRIHQWTYIRGFRSVHKFQNLALVRVDIFWMIQNETSGWRAWCLLSAWTHRTGVLRRPHQEHKLLSWVASSAAYAIQILMMSQNYTLTIRGADNSHQRSSHRGSPTNLPRIAYFALEKGWKIQAGERTETNNPSPRVLSASQDEIIK